MTDTDSHVVLLATGGTISSRSSSAGGAVASDTGEQVFKALGARVSHPVRVLDVFQKGSYLLTFEDMLRVCAAIKEVLKDPKVLGVVVTHGTDTMEETAYLADLTHGDQRPVVFTGSQRAADSEAPDGPENVARAIAVAGSNDAKGKGVMVYFAGTIFPAAGVRKSQTLRLNAFANPDFGVLGEVSAQGEVAMAGCGGRLEALPLPPPGDDSPRVDLVAAYPGADSTLMHAALEAGAAGIVLQGTGSGNANASLCSAVAAAVASGVVVVTSTRVDSGPVVPIYGAGGGGEDLRAAGAIGSSHLRPSQSLILLNLLLRLNPDRERIAEIFAQRGRPPEPSP
ncbi:L-asparaginase [Arthrobacter sp. V1I9]|jgi:L-asparaginase|uniref:asparaginase n=1 Tax=Arthrobacter sp. V1I9 TaxID=3042275 RepID=UPI00278FD947|nr:asparaginase [Arthrobacter sp. V1I9]MDQ0870232.1 L-asparaginase [Arthrobacter sp. V1I9]